jgi:hypothetical protein
MRLNLLRRTAFAMRSDLLQPPVVGHERLGIAVSRFASLYNQDTIVITRYLPLPRNAYIEGGDAPVSFDSRWLMRAAEEFALGGAGFFLTHLHDHKGRPWFSPTDMRTNQRVIRPIALVDQALPIGALVLSVDGASALLARSDGLIAVPVHDMVG